MTNQAAMTKHTAGPWTVDAQKYQVRIVGPSRDFTVMATGRVNELSQANAARIVACVNACEGMDDPAEAILQLREEIQQRAPISTVDGLTDKERELAAALRPLLAYVRCGKTSGCQSTFTLSEFNAARAALAKLDAP